MKNNLIKQMCGKLTNAQKQRLIAKLSALALAGSLTVGGLTACDSLGVETQPQISKETQGTLHTPTTTVPETTAPETTMPEIVLPETPTEYVSDAAKNLFNSAEYLGQKAELVEAHQYASVQAKKSAYGTSFNPTNYDYFKTIYPNATEEEICYGTKVYTDFTVDDDLYVCFASKPRLNGINDGNHTLYSLFKYENLAKDVLNDLELSKDNTLNHSLLLKHIIENNAGIQLTESLVTSNGLQLGNLDIINTARKFLSFNGANNDKKYCYIIAENNEEKTLYYLEFPYTEEEKAEDVYKQKYGFDGVGIGYDNQYTNLEKIGALDYIITSNVTFDKMIEKEITLN